MKWTGNGWAIGAVVTAVGISFVAAVSSLANDPPTPRQPPEDSLPASATPTVPPTIPAMPALPTTGRLTPVEELPTTVVGPGADDPQGIVAALLKIRRRNGSWLEGTVFDSEDSEEAFAAALKRVIQQAPPLPVAERVDVGEAPFQALPGTGDISEIDRQVVDLVDTAARLLDEKAALLEKDQRYNESDEAHRTARRLRHMIRDVRDQVASPDRRAR